MDPEERPKAQKSHHTKLTNVFPLFFQNYKDAKFGTPGSMEKEKIQPENSPARRGLLSAPLQWMTLKEFSMSLACAYWLQQLFFSKKGCTILQPLSEVPWWRTCDKGTFQLWKLQGGFLENPHTCEPGFTTQNVTKATGCIGQVLWNSAVHPTDSLAFIKQNICENTIAHVWCPQTILVCAQTLQHATLCVQLLSTSRPHTNQPDKRRPMLTLVVGTVFHTMEIVNPYTTHDRRTPCLQCSEVNVPQPRKTVFCRTQQYHIHISKCKARNSPSFSFCEITEVHTLGFFVWAFETLGLLYRLNFVVPFWFTRTK